MSSDTSYSFSTDSSRRRSTFYVPLTPCQSSSTAGIESKDHNVANSCATKQSTRSRTASVDNSKHDSMERIYNPDLSACSFGWSLDESSCHDSSEVLAVANSEHENKLKRYGVVLNASVNIDDDGTKCHQQQRSNTSTPIRLVKSRSRSSILCQLPREKLALGPKGASSGIICETSKKECTIDEPLLSAKEKSKTLPQNVSLANSFPSKSSFIMHSTPRISLNCSFDANDCGSVVGLTPEPPAPVTNYMLSPKKSLSFIRRTHSTKLSRSNSLLKSLTSKCVDQNACHTNLLRVPVKDLNYGRLHQILENPSKVDQFIKDLFLWCKDEKDEESAVHSDTSYEKACRRGSAPNTPVMDQKESTSRFTNFFSKRSFRSIPLKRTKSATKLERSKRGQGGIRGSRSHESLLSNHGVMSTIDLSCVGVIEVVPVHSSVLGRRNCFQVRGISRGERYYSCGTRQERDLWIYSLRKSVAPNKDSVRRLDNSMKMWIYEAKSLQPKKRYFCEIYLDKTLYGRTSVKLRADLLFWGEFFDFPDVPGVSVITVNVFREADKKKKRDKHVLVGSVTIPIEKVVSRTFTEDWYQIMMEKHDHVIKSTSKEAAPTLRIKCRYQSIDILPLDVYHEFLNYLKENYKKVCEIIEPIIGVKAKEDIGQALVLLMHSQGMAAAFLSDVVALDLLRVDDQRLTFRGNSLATKSMEAFLKLIGEQYLQDTLSIPVAEIIASDRDCEVDPTKVHGSLSRQQQALRKAVKSVWIAIAESNRNFPVPLRDCFSTFRERLQDLDRDDMADNLISASIFLRFLCPAILSPSLFNITNELPSARATRNLTLVAKTLQTLANFTRFQGKENFMEFLNDFLEQEAPRMKQFLYDISNNDCHTPDNVLDWSGCIDQGKQLSILHSLLSEIVLKLPQEKQHEIHPLAEILESIAKIKENGYSNVAQEPERGVQSQFSQYNSPAAVENEANSKISPNRSDSIQGINIFNYNDPTVDLQRQASKYKSSSNSSLNHTKGISNISLVSNSMQHSSGSIKHIVSPRTVDKFHHNQYGSSGINTGGSLRSYMSTGPSAYGIISNISTNSLRSEKEKNVIVKGDTRASTLPRYNNYTTNVAVGENILVNGSQVVEFDCDVERNSAFNDVSKNLIQIDIDPSNPFNRKSPTPLTKNLSNHLHNISSRRNNGSQLSIVSPASDLGDLSKTAISLGIPHSEASQDQQYTPCANTSIPLKISNIAKISPFASTQPSSSNPSKMPMSLEDLEDLLNYADEQKQSASGEGASSRSASSSGGCESATTNTKPQLVCIGSNFTIGQISNICSSGYQSIPTQSASSSPVELAGQQRIEYVTNKAPPPRKLVTTLSGYNAASGLNMCLNEHASKTELMGNSINAQLYKQRDPSTVTSIIKDCENDHDREASFQQKSISRILNNNYVDSSTYDAIPPYKISLSSNQPRNLGHSTAKGNTRISAEDNIEYFGANRLQQQYRQKRNIHNLNVMRNSRDSVHSESSSDERFSNTTSENYNEHDSLTAINSTTTNRIVENINNSNDYDTSAAGLCGRRIGSNRMPRTNPLLQYKRDDSMNGLNHGHIGVNNSLAPFANGRIDLDQGMQTRYHRRLSLECARTLSDSSTDETESDTTKAANSNHHMQHHHTTCSTTHHMNLRDVETKKRRNANKSVEQCEREIQRLQASLDTMRQKLEMSELTGEDKDKTEAVTHHSDNKIRSIIGRLLTMEEELRQEQYKMSLVLSHKQRVIEAQGQQIAALDAANNRLLSALSSLQNRYESHSNQSDDTSSSHPNAGASSC
ncbi:ras GTPase-activating protein raskol [Anopheles nili]|uniref:ras GTPase-activating protein raskol n=1 Tax=Anopheles nili TaxID=185578 RepID=UPI00237BE980|nr:ras GTPase-activating protein raskol [Anopheles nili]